MRKLLSTLIVLIVLLVPVLGLAFEIEVVNNTEGKLAYQVYEVKETPKGFGTFGVASGELDPQTRVTEPQDFPAGQYIMTIVLANKNKLQVLKNHIIVDPSVIKILINSHEIRASKGV